jgi:hypothetical protein
MELLLVDEHLQLTHLKTQIAAECFVALRFVFVPRAMLIGSSHVPQKPYVGFYSCKFKKMITLMYFFKKKK